MFFWGLKSRAQNMGLRMFYRGLVCSMFLNVVSFVGVDILNVSMVYFTPRATARHETTKKEKGQ